MPTPPPDDVCLNKAAIIERAIRRMRIEYAANPGLDNYTHIDALTLNVERACQAAIDLAMHLVARDHLGVPQSSADAFRLLAATGRITPDTVRAMAAMTAFRNIAVHEYQELDLTVLRAIAESRWTSLVVYIRELGLVIQP
jgi:uncharacterized protein YutE (UPF0331/DUF86 family)